MVVSQFAGVKPGLTLLAVCPPYEPEIDAGYYEAVAISQGTTGME